MSEKPPLIDFATKPGEPYCGNCGYNLSGLADSLRCPECGKPIIEVLMRREFSRAVGKRYRSSARLFGLPVVDIALGPSGAERRGKARGIIAIGDSAVGWIAIGSFARGIVAIGAIAIGVFAMGAWAIGLLTAFGGGAIALTVCTGGLSLGGISFGGVAVGFIAQGRVSIGHFARGASAIGRRFPPRLRQLHWLLGKFPPTPLDSLRPMLLTLGPLLVAGGLICLLALARTNSVKGEDQSPTGGPD